jgi:FkbM family methyltransferase
MQQESFCWTQDGIAGLGDCPAVLWSNYPQMIDPSAQKTRALCKRKPRDAPFDRVKLTKKFVSVIKRLDRKLWPSHRVALEPGMAEALVKRSLLVADVGAAEGPEDRWLGVKHLTRFLTFEPNPRSETSQDDRTVCLPIGLWSSKTRKTLHLTEHPDSASLYPANEEVFRDFLVKDGMATAGTLEIALDTLDNVLVAHPELTPDFLKIDAEGADLEVLRGGVGTLERSVMGLRIETSLLELRQGAPSLWEMDAFLRERGFCLFHLGRVHWIRNNGLLGFTSQPQLIWGDAVYFLTRERLMARLVTLRSQERDAALARFVLMLLCHGVHDYAVEVVEAAEVANLVTSSFAASLKAAVINSADRSILYFLWSSVGLSFALSAYLVCWPAPSARLRAKYYVKQRAGRLFYDLWRWAARGGRPNNACIEDPFV